MLSLLLVLALGQNPGEHACSGRPSHSNRTGARCGSSSPYPSTPALPSAPDIAFYFAPVGGWGVAPSGNACTGQVITDASMQPLTWGRSSVATCIRESDGLGVELASGEPHVMSMPGAANHYGVLVEQQSSNFLIWSQQLDKDVTDAGAAAWVPTAVVTPDFWPGPFSHYRTEGGFEKLDDSSALLSLGDCQTFATTTQTTYAFSCWLRSGTLTTARLSMTGVGNSAGDRTCAVTGLDSTLSRDDRKGCVGTAAYGAGITAITACVSVGAVDGDTGTIGAVDCQIEKLDHITSYMRTQTTSSTRLVSTLAFPALPATLTLSDTAGCNGAEMYATKYDAETFWSVIPAGRDTARSVFYFPDTTARIYDGTNSVTTAVASVWNRNVDGVGTWSDGGLRVTIPGTGTNVGTYDGTMYGGSISTLSMFVEPNNTSKDALVGNVRFGLDGGVCNTQTTMTSVSRAGWVGDSISASYPVGLDKIPTRTFLRLGLNGSNFAVGGSVFTDIIAQWATSGNATYDRVFLWGGVNDILAGTDGHTLFTTQKNWVAEWLYRGIKVYWIDITPFKGYDSTASKLTARNNFNSDWATYCGTAPTGLQCFEVSSLVWDSGDHDALASSNTVDGIHPSLTMANTVAAYIAANYVP